MKTLGWMNQEQLGRIAALEEQGRYIRSNIATAIGEVNAQAVQILHKALPNEKNPAFDLSIWSWDCADSPIEVCVYAESDYNSDNCLFCHEPSERK